VLGVFANALSLFLMESKDEDINGNCGLFYGPRRPDDR